MRTLGGSGGGLRTTSEPSNGKSSFEEFLLAEYDNIAHAHFNTVDSIANFTKHYIAIASIPFAIAALLSGSERSSGSGIGSFMELHPVVVPVFLFMVSLVGLLVLGYIISIRMDALLYARAVNGIRKYFYDRSNLTATQQAKSRVLPISTSVPKYFEGWYFGFVVSIFMIVDSSYLAAGLYFYWQVAKLPMGYLIALIALVFAFAAMHWILYAALAKHREKAYLQACAASDLPHAR
jgi:hypothetical protein